MNGNTGNGKRWILGVNLERLERSKKGWNGKKILCINLKGVERIFLFAHLREKWNIYSYRGYPYHLSNHQDYNQYRGIIPIPPYILTTYYHMCELNGCEVLNGFDKTWVPIKCPKFHNVKSLGPKNRWFDNQFFCLYCPSLWAFYWDPDSVNGSLRVTL